MKQGMNPRPHLSVDILRNVVRIVPLPLLCKPQGLQFFGQMFRRFGIDCDRFNKSFERHRRVILIAPHDCIKIDRPFLKLILGFAKIKEILPFNLFFQDHFEVFAVIRAPGIGNNSLKTGLIDESHVEGNLLDARHLVALLVLDGGNVVTGFQ